MSWSCSTLEHDLQNWRTTFMKKEILLTLLDKLSFWYLLLMALAMVPSLTCLGDSVHGGV
jgi:hypothetical protein